ncbi:MAG: D-alanyl-D-alanine carboxypeptidase family protein [Clostridia bacterium]
MKIFVLIAFVLNLVVNQVYATSVSAKSAVIIDSDTLEILYGKSEDTVMSMASTTKIMTALVALEHADLEREIEIKLEYTLVEGSSMYLREGEIVTMIDLLYGLMLMSGNDSAIAIAHETTGNYDEFIDLMNEKALELELFNTSFENPNGLDAENHHTTALELAKLSAYAMQNEQFQQIVSSKYHETDSRIMQNHNKMLWLVDEAIGIKTGYTKSSGRCLVSAVTINEKTLVAVTLDAPSDWADHMAMFDDAFGMYDMYNIQNNGDVFGEVAIYGGDESLAKIVFLENVNINLTASQKKELTTTVISEKINYSPIKKGEIYGEIVYNIGNVEIYRCNLYYDDEIGFEYVKEMNIFEKFIDFVRNLFY